MWVVVDIRSRWHTINRAQQKYIIMIKHWTINAMDGARATRLYVTSSDEAIQQDLNLPEYQSLVHSGRQLINRTECNKDSDHMDFAKGAFTTIASDKYTNFRNLELVNFIPEGLNEVWVGGDGTNFVARVFIEQ